MKTRFASMLVLATALSALFSASLTAATTTTVAQAIRVRTADDHGWNVTRGMPAQKVLNRFGAPDARLSDNVWVYNRFHAVQEVAQSDGCGTLVVTIAGGVVSDLQLVNDRAQAIITARLQTAKAPGTVVATK